MATVIDRPLTTRQREVLDYYVRYEAEHGRAPAMRDVAFRFLLSSTNGVNDFLISLERKGYVRRRDMISRGVEITEKGRAEILGPPCGHCGGSGRRQRRHQ